jgi:hydroxyethylthiazole kinase-like uncharacterized protein yjeF
VVLLAAAEDLKGDAAANYRMLLACGGTVEREIPARARMATVVVDALLGTGLAGPATGRMLEGIREINDGFPLAKVVAVDIPSGLPSDAPDSSGEFARADLTVTFTAPKVAHALPPNSDRMGELVVGAIGSPASLYEDVWLSVIEPAMFRELLAPRPRSGHKGTFGHVLVVAGSPGKTGAAAMTGIAALRAGAGLVTVASDERALASIAAHAPELMTAAFCGEAFEGKTVIAIGPGLGANAVEWTRGAAEVGLPMVVDADALAGAGGLWPLAAVGNRRAGWQPALQILTPHPGEMARLTGKSTAEVQADRVGVARAFAMERGVTLVLKGQRTVVAFADGRVWINPTGTPAMGTGGSGDILTGLTAGLLAQFPTRPDDVVAGAAYLHGRAGELAARELGEKCVISTDILKFLGEAMREAAGARDV